MNKLNIELLKQILETHRPSYYGDSWVLDAVLKLKPTDSNMVVDGYGNLFVLVGDSEQSDVAFTCHTDTVARTKSAAPVVGVKEDRWMYVQNPEQADCLGADDGAGIYLMLEMLKQGVHGRYCFFRDEEVGCVGSRYSAQDKTGFWTGVKAMISFDRRGDDIITSQRNQRCCSNTFALALAARLGRPESALKSGIYTDSAEFMQIIPECTNVGVGYYGEHGPDEVLDLHILEKLLQAVLEPGTFKNLPILRDPMEIQPMYQPLHVVHNPLDWECPELLSMFRELSTLPVEQLVQWVQDNPVEAAQYITVFSDYGFKGELVDVGSRVVDDWGGWGMMFNSIGEQA